MGDQNNGELIRSGYEAFSKGDMETIAKIFGPDIRWNISGRSQVAGTYNGQEETFAFFGRLMELTGGTFVIAVHDLLATDDHVVVLAQESASRNGKSLEADDVHVWHLTNGRAVEFWGIAKDQHAVDEFWA
ncbi:MAG: nuclear transport factor 2 family protein [Acidimicrobiales bacterium]